MVQSTHGRQLSNSDQSNWTARWVVFHGETYCPLFSLSTAIQSYHWSRLACTDTRSRMSARIWGKGCVSVVRDEKRHWRPEMYSREDMEFESMWTLQSVGCGPGVEEVVGGDHTSKRMNAGSIWMLPSLHNISRRANQNTTYSLTFVMIDGRIRIALYCVT